MSAFGNWARKSSISFLPIHPGYVLIVAVPVSCEPDAPEPVASGELELDELPQAPRSHAADRPADRRAPPAISSRRVSRLPAGIIVASSAMTVAASSLVQVAGFSTLRYRLWS